MEIVLNVIIIHVLHATLQLQTVLHLALQIVQLAILQQFVKTAKLDILKIVEIVVLATILSVVLVVDLQPTV